MSNGKVRKRVIRICGSRCRQNFYIMFIYRQKNEKLEVQKLWCQGRLWPRKLFFAKMCFLNARSKTHFLQIFNIFEGSPHPGIFHNFRFRSNFRFCFSICSSFCSTITFRLNFPFRVWELFKSNHNFIIFWELEVTLTPNIFRIFVFVPNFSFRFNFLLLLPFYVATPITLSVEED